MNVDILLMIAASVRMNPSPPQLTEQMVLSAWYAAVAKRWAHWDASRAQAAETRKYLASNSAGR